MKEILNVCNEALFFKISVYEADRSLMAITAFCITGEPYVTLTYSPYVKHDIPVNTFFVCINASEEINEILKAIGAEPVLKGGHSVVGFDCVSIYQLFKLDLDTLTKMDPEGYALYLSMRSKSMGI